MLVSIERFIAVRNLKLNLKKIKCLRFHRIEKIIVLVGILLGLINTHYLIYFDLIKINVNPNNQVEMHFLNDMTLFENIKNNITQLININNSNFKMPKHLINK